MLRQELLSLGEPDVEAVLDALGRHRLLSFDRDPVTRGPTVEIAHEALLAEWNRLRGWIDANREDVRQQRRLAAAADEWQAVRPGCRLPVGGDRLDQLAAWAALTDLSLDPGERAILMPASTGETRSEPPKRTAAATKSGFGCGPAGAPAF